MLIKLRPITSGVVILTHYRGILIKQHGSLPRFRLNPDSMDRLCLMGRS